MKNIIILSFSIVFASCASSPPITESHFNFYDLFFVTKTNQYVYLDMPKKDVISLLGQPDKIFMTENYNSGIGFSYGDNELVLSIIVADYSKDIEYSTLRGINIRSKYNDILKTYGKSYYKEKGNDFNLIYWFDPLRDITFETNKAIEDYFTKYNGMVIGIIFMFDVADKSNLKSIYIASYGKKKSFDSKKYIEDMIKNMGK
jgi:hypothetical protein